LRFAICGWLHPAANDVAIRPPGRSSIPESFNPIGFIRIPDFDLLSAGWG
jgi:hypothetical protein